MRQNPIGCCRSVLQSGVFLAAAIWGGQQGGHSVFGARIPGDVMSD